VILDSGPVLSVSDPIALAVVCDHVLLVGDYRRTTRRYVARALAELAEVVHGNVSGVLLNAPRRAGGLVPYGRPQHAGAKPIPGAAAQAALGSARVPPVSTVYSSSSASTPVIAGKDRKKPGADLPLRTGDQRRRLSRRG
jgi:hypothetical protein